MAVAAAAGGVSSYACGSGAVSPTTVDNYDDYSVLSRLHPAVAITASIASFRAPPYCTSMSQMRPAVALGTHQQTAGGLVRGGTLHGGQAGPTTGQTALPYAVGFTLSAEDVLRQPPLAGFQGILVSHFNFCSVSLISAVGLSIMTSVCPASNREQAVARVDRQKALPEIDAAA